MAETYTLQAQPRTETGKKVRRLRADGNIPAVLYGHKIKPLALTVPRGELEKVYRKAGGSSVVTIKMPDGEQTVLIHEIQDDPITGQHLHADFFVVRMDEKIKTEVPLVFEGQDQAPAVRELDGVFITNINELEVECLPGDLPSEIVVNCETLETFEDAITVADIKVPEGVAVLNDPEANVAAVTPPRTEAEMEELEEAPEELDVDAVEGMAEGEEGEAGAEGEEGAEGEAPAESDTKADAKPEAKGDDQKPDKS